MWKRLNRDGNQASGADGTIFEDEYSSANVQSYGEEQSGSIWGGKPPARPSRDKVAGLPPLHFDSNQDRSGPPSSYMNTQSRSSHRRPVSSVYSQASPQFPESAQFTSDAGAVYDDVEISPPSSPEVAHLENETRHPVNNRSVSQVMRLPAEEISNGSRLQADGPTPVIRPKGGSSIPVLRREKRRNQVAQAAATLLSKNQTNHGDDIRNKRGTEPLYDPLTGEFTTSDRGRRQQVKPGEFAPPKVLLGTRTTITDPSMGKNSFGDRIRNLKDNSMNMDARPEWKGSSGRSQPVHSVSDLDFIPPLRIPPKSSLRSNSPRNSDSGSVTPVSTAYQTSKHETPSVSSTSTLGNAGSTIRKLIPERTGRNYEDITDYVFSPIDSTPKTSSQENNQPRSPQSAPSKTQPPPRDDSTSTIERNFREALRDIPFSTAQGYEQPLSRFSVTTYATTTANSTPRVSEDSVPPMPSLPAEPDMIVERTRPKIGRPFDATRTIARKAIGTEPVFIGMTSASRRNSKMLPKSPAERASTDMITSLEAQLEDLKNQRVNLERSIHQMTELMPQDPMARGMEIMRQAEEKKRVEAMREDLADVVKDEHDLGLRLHRAWKKKDAEAVYEPTGLWVRRMTS